MKTILVIDDDETILDIVKETLEQSDFVVITAQNGEDGLKRAASDAPDGIILDIRMPGMDGDKVLEQLQADEATKHIPVMMLTSLSRISDVSGCFDLGAKDYIVKPFSHDNLILRLNNVLS